MAGKWSREGDTSCSRAATGKRSRRYKAEFLSLRVIELTSSRVKLGKPRLLMKPERGFQ